MNITQMTDAELLHYAEAMDDPVLTSQLERELVNRLRASVARVGKLEELHAALGGLLPSSDEVVA